MITLSHEQMEKINLLDRLFTSVDVDQLRQFVESEQVVAKLKGTGDNPHIILNLVHEYDAMKLDFMNTKIELSTLRTDFQLLLKVLQADVFTPRYNQDFTNLKCKYQIY